MHKKAEVRYLQGVKYAKYILFDNLRNSSVENNDYLFVNNILPNIHHMSCYIFSFQSQVQKLILAASCFQWEFNYTFVKKVDIFKA